MKKVYFLTTAVLAFCLIAGVSNAVERRRGVSLFNGKDLEGWKLRKPDGQQSWSVVEGVLHNEAGHDKPGTDLCTDQKFGDCRLHIEFRVPKGGNSGVYLQGRYEVQVEDSAGQKLRNTMCGAVYGKIAPSENAALAAGEWQTYDIFFRQAQVNEAGEVTAKARITVVHNEKRVIDNKEIDGVTGGAIDNKEGTPGPLMLQGDHSSIDYRNIVISPLRVSRVSRRPAAAAAPAATEATEAK
jgi:hypothetical protein